MPCIEHGLVSGEQMVTDGTFIPVNVSSGWKQRSKNNEDEIHNYC